MITVVSGLPRSGTSLTMQMLVAGGIPALSDGLRTPDENNPKGYFEWEPAKTLQDFVKSQIAPYKYPRAIEFAAELPRTATGKLQRFRLREGS